MNNEKTINTMEQMVLKLKGKLSQVESLLKEVNNLNPSNQLKNNIYTSTLKSSEKRINYLINSFYRSTENLDRETIRTIRFSINREFNMLNFLEDLILENPMFNKLNIKMLYKSS